MKEKLKQLERFCDNPKEVKVLELFNSVIESLSNRIDEYIGDYPTFIEPVYLGKNVKIGDDVLLGPNVYIGANTVVGDYVEISNSIIFDNVLIGENFTLENCVVCANSKLKFSNFKSVYSILKGEATSIDELSVKKLK